MCVVRNLVLHLLKLMRKQVPFLCVCAGEVVFWKVAWSNFLILQIMIIFLNFKNWERERVWKPQFQIQFANKTIRA